MSTTFIGRSFELKLLQSLYGRSDSTLVVLKGRRRIGKSRLIREFANRANPPKFWQFEGLAPSNKIDHAAQLQIYASQLAVQSNQAPRVFLDWRDALHALGEKLKAGDIVFFDEISWMAEGDPRFIAKLKIWWDHLDLRVFLCLCGSSSTWIEENIIKSTALYGRINHTLSLSPFSIPENKLFLDHRGAKLSDYCAYKVMATLGGIPWYLEQYDPKESEDLNIKRLCFTPGGALTDEFNIIFHDLFQKKGQIYRKIMQVLLSGPKTLDALRTELDYAHSGTLSQHAENLEAAGFIEKTPLWSIKSAKLAKQSLYRICDPYIRFYLKNIDPHLNAIKKGAFIDRVASHLRGYEGSLGIAVENLLLQNTPLIRKAIGIDPLDVLQSGPYRQNKTSNQAGCQIDYMLQSRTQTLYICEFKFGQKELGVELIEAMKNKISALKIPRGYAAAPVLCHFGWISNQLRGSDYFYRIIDLADFLRPESN